MEEYLTQGTEEWLNWRKGKITGSKAPIIMNLSPYCTPLELFEEELGMRDPQPSSPHMTRGLDIEDEARQRFKEITGIVMTPSVEVHKSNPLFIASLDGINDSKTMILEIKNNNNEYHEMVRLGQIPAHHYAQVQHQMYVTDLEECHYLSYRKGDLIHLVLKADKPFIKQMVVKCLEFKKMLENLTPPELTDRDYEDFSDRSDLTRLSREYQEVNWRIKSDTEILEGIKKNMLNIVGEKNAKGSGWKVTRYTTIGRINYDAIEELKNVDLEKYRKQPTVSFRITVEK